MSAYTPPVFENDQLPQLLYITRQTYTQDHMVRPIHRHEDIVELLLVEKGAGRYDIENHTYGVNAGDILLYNAGDLHEVVADQGHSIQTLCFGMNELHLTGFAPEHLVQPGDWYVRACEDNRPMLSSLADNLYTYLHGLEHQTPDELCRHLLASVVLLALSQPTKAGDILDPQEYALVTRIRSYIDEHYAEAVTLADISQALCISPYYAAHLFKKVTGSSPIQYLIRRRIGEAQSLLIGSDYTATQISTMVGYDNTNYFNTVFSRAVGLSPIRYRKKFCQSMEGRFIQ